MIKSIHAPGTCDFVTEIYELSKKKKVKVYPAMLVSIPEVMMLRKALGILRLPLIEIIYDDSFMEAKPENAFGAKDKYSKFMFCEDCRYVSFEDVKKFREENSDTEVVILSNHNPSKQDFFIDVLEKAGVECTLYHLDDIKHTVTLDGQVMVLNEVEHVKSWPYEIETLFGQYVTPEETERYCHGRFPYINTGMNTYFCLENHRSILNTIYNGFLDCGEYKPVPGMPKKTVTCIGDSRFFTPCNPSRLHVPSVLQKKITDEGKNIEVRNFSTLANNLQNALAQIKSLDLSSDDIIICSTFNLGIYANMGDIGKQGNASADESDKVIRAKFLIMKEIKEYCESRGADVIFLYIPSVNEMPRMTPMEEYITKIYGRCYKPDISHRKLQRLCLANNIRIMDLSEETFNADPDRISNYSDLTHFSVDMAKMIVDSIYDYVINVADRETERSEDREMLEMSVNAHRNFVQKILRSRVVESEEYLSYLRKVSEGKPENSGIILMNCNPFTLGHRYLVEEALKQADHLYIIVVPEENPHFSFADRFEMAKQAVADLKNVEVVNSSNVFGTRALFPEYFEREKNPDVVVDVSNDIYVFCNQIAPALKAKKRFVGTEPNDRVTCQFNEQLKAALPDAGIELIEIPRKSLGERPISASDVRRFMKNNEFDELKKLVPLTTYNYIKNKLSSEPQK